MFDNFEAEFGSSGYPGHVESCASLPAPEVLATLFARYGGRSFRQGIYRVLSPETADHWASVIISAFPTYAGRIRCFGMDWLGRCFALDSERLEGGGEGVVMFEPGTGEALEVPCNLISFHEGELIQYREAALAESFYREWLENGGAAPTITQCIGYRTPLFLGGSDTLGNLELSDMDVYWTISAQLIQKTRSLPIGTVLPRISIE
ncbi:DUF1851 domain-containing protein [Massilia sp. H6]|uniref:DUF1851 domain-containing protein n=1 Tax=Massilia sp. H6 TaxID=2970464 RepID=UPI0021681220|nr:DUF1851 domain-containing protein [Massilia sp. H6]UVW28435.1 DUF1851 domain-containing protein [Massilia sp. H6]